MANRPWKGPILDTLVKLRKYKKRAIGVNRQKAQDLMKRIHELLKGYNTELHTNKPVFIKKYNRILQEAKKLLEE